MLTGGLVVLTGMVITPVAHYFNVSMSEAGRVFTWMNLGILVAIVANSGLMDIIPLKRQISISFAMTCVAFIGLSVTQSLPVFCVLMFLLGLVSGVTMSVSTYLIAHLYAGKNRGMMLLLTDSFFSLAGIIFPLIAGIMLSRSISWYWLYSMVLIASFFVFVLSIGIKFPRPADSNFQTKDKPLSERLIADMKQWGIAVYACGLGCMLYILGQLCLVFWIPNYAVSQFHATQHEKSTPLSFFWIGMWIGLYIASVLVKKMSMTLFVCIIAISATVLFYLIRHAHSLHEMTVFCFVMGLFSAGIYYTLITLASLQVSIPSPLLVNFALAAGTVGTFLTPLVAAKAVSIGGPAAALWTGNLFYLSVFIIALIVALTSKHNKMSENPSG